MSKIKDDLYKVLGVKQTATKEEIKKAGHDKSKKAHPDMPGGSHEQQQKINQAVMVLTDDMKREAYDNDADDLKPAEQEALSMAIGVFMKNISEDPFTNFIDKTIAQLEQSKLFGRQELQKDVGSIQLYRTILERLETRKGASRGLLHNAIETEIGGFERSIRHAEHVLKIHDLAIEMIKEYKYNPDQREDSPLRQNLYVNITGGNTGTGAW